MKDSFTLIELLIILAVIAAIIAAIVPTGIYAVKRAHTITVALDLSMIYQAAAQEFYLNHNETITMENIKPYFSSGHSNDLKNYAIKTTIGATVQHIYIWYKGNTVNASMVKSVLYSTVSTDDNKPMLIMTVKKYW